MDFGEEHADFFGANETKDQYAGKFDEMQGEKNLVDEEAQEMEYVNH